MFRISRTTRAYYLTSVAHNRLPVFRTDKVKEVVCKALDEARKSAGFLIFAYVVMTDHIHLITDNTKSIKETLRFINGITARRVIDYLKENNFESFWQNFAFRSASVNTSIPCFSIIRMRSRSMAKTR
jgi:putative transposase